jgi:hypothetical protein
LYHRPSRRFPSGAPFLNVGITAAEVAGVALSPALLSKDLTRFPAGLPTTGFLPLSDSGIRPKIPPAEMTSLDHPGPPERKQSRPLYRVISRKERTDKPRRLQNYSLIPSDSTFVLFGILFTAAYTRLCVRTQHVFSRRLGPGLLCSEGITLLSSLL